MKQKQLKLEIHDPCGESWDKMTEAGCGRFCAACSKTVVDFSTMSDKEVLGYFLQNSTGVCGRFTPDQLGRTFRAPEKTSSLFTPVRQFVAASLLILGQGLMSVKGYAAPDPTRIIAVAAETSNDTGLYIRGRVMDHVTNMPIPGMEVRVGETDLKTVSDSAGRFVFSLPRQYLGKRLWLNVYYYHKENWPAIGTTMRGANIQLTENASQTEVILYRYPVAAMPDATIKTSRVTTNYGYYQGGASIIWVEEPKKPGVFRRFVNLFRKKDRP